MSSGMRFLTDCTGWPVRLSWSLMKSMTANLNCRHLNAYAWSYISAPSPTRGPDTTMVIELECSDSV